jgi:uncharacterized damage-inducible protein DinB
MKTYFQDLFRYDLWANRRMLDAVLEAGVEDSQITTWLNHIVNAEQIWLDRMETGETELSPVQDFLLADCKARMEKAHAQIMAWLAGLTEEALQSGLAHYANSKGTAFETPWIGILAHVINHSTHHRAQVAARFRELGHVPPPTDYIFYLREK